ncbi:uncharacterized protein ACNFOS_007609 [Eudromia elegans]
MSGAAGRALLWCALVWAWELSRGQLRYSVPEEMQKGSFVGDVAKDLGLQLSALRDRGVRVVSEGRRQYFSLHEKTGHLVTAERIDREELCEAANECELRCEVIVEDEMKVYAIEVEVRDINDNAPAFKEAQLEEIISETTAPGSRFPLRGAQDPDIESNSLQRYELSGDEHFSLVVQTTPEGEKYPELVLERPLDREEAAFHELVLTAVDGGDPSRTGTARIRVVVLDANDNAPVFSQAVYTVRVREDVPVGSVLLTVTATDADDGMNGNVKYSFQKISVKASEIFNLDTETGVITLVKTLDFEQSDSYDLQVQAKDGGGLSDTAKVTITVTDVNDNAPELTVMSSLSEVPEDCPPGTVVALLHVQDRDSGANGEVRCSLGAGLPFRLRSSLGSYYSVETSRELDREAVSEYNVTVRATDGGSPSLWSSAVLPLRVLDVNDNAPVFAEARYSARVSENNAAGALVLRVRAWDADWGENARVRYGLCEGQVRGAPLSSYVSVHAETGALYALRSFDYEEVREVGLWVRAEDGGAPALSSNVSVRLEIVDENDNAPQVLYPAPSSSSSWSGVELSPRSAEPGTLVAKVVAVDADSGQNAWLSYEVVKATDPGLFRVGVHSGEVRTARLAVSRDALRQSLVVLVKDHGEPALSATATLTLVLAESVAELLWEAGGAAAPGGGEDEDDSGVMVTRWLVVAVSGVGCLLVALLVALVALRVREWRRCRELGAGSGSVRAVPASQFVGIEGVRAFLHSYAHDVSLSGDWRKRQLGCPGGSCCNTLPAAPPPDKGAPLLLPEEPSSARGDADSGDALLPEPQSEPEPPQPPPGGCCSQSGGRDRHGEKKPPRGWELSAAETAAAERLRYAIAEETGSGSVVGPLARDLGLSPAELPARQLRISSEERYFAVSADSGELYVSERLDREEMCGDSASCSVSFEAIVQNPLNVFQVDVDIQDINDNAPVFSKAALDLEIGEWILPGSRFPLEMAHDPDVGSNSQLSYQLTENPSFRLALKEKSGGKKQPELVLEAALDREKQSSFEMVLTAVDGGSPSRSGTVQIRINVTDANDNAPVFSKSAYEARVRENVATGSLVLQVRATDADAGSNGRVSYSFSNVPDAVRAVFSIDSESGDIRNVGTLDFEERKEYTFEVEAKDGGGLSDHSQVHVEITDENDNAPEITVLSVSSSVPEDSPAGTVVALLKVRDRDSGENGQVWCELEGDSPLSIVASSGSSYKVVTASALDRERASEHNVTVVASDRGMPSLRSRTALSLSVSDVNDNAPVFEEAAYSAYVWENNAAGASVLRVRARDADAGANGRVSYWLVGVSAGSASSAAAAPSVSVEARSGALYAQRSLDYEQCREFAVQVRAQDGGSPARSSTATVRVFVLDLNDNAPQVLWPAASVSGSSSVASGPFEVVPRSAEAGYVVSKVVAVDADSGRNAWLSYELVQATEPSLFRVSLQSGEVRTARSVSERDASRQRLVVLVKDHGEPSLSATATLHVVLAESLQEALPALSERASGAEAPWDLQFYLVLALALLCALLVLSVALAVAARLRGAGPPAVLRCLRAERLSAAGAAFPADFCEGTLPYSYNLCVAPGRALAECALLPAPLPSRAVDDLLGGDPPAALPPSSSRAPPEPPSDSDALQKQMSLAVYWCIIGAERLELEGRRYFYADMIAFYVQLYS